MIQDIFPHIYHNEYKPVVPDSNSIILAYENGKCFFHREENSNTIALPRFKELEGQLSDLYENYIYLFSIDDDRFYLIPGLDTNLLPECDFYEARTLRYTHPQHLSFAVITGHQLYQWYRSHQYCGYCGHAMKHDTNERMMYCPNCSQHEYPVLMPAVIVAITNGDKIILSKYKGRGLKQYALIAGFAEIGETIEETVHREVMEEVGLKVKNLRYYKSQPWSFSGTLLFGFFCDVDGADTLTVDHEELSIAQWFERDKIIGQDTNSSLTNEMKVVSDHIFTKSKSSALTNEKFAAFIQENGIDEFYIAGADAAACVKSTCYNMTKAVIPFMCCRTASRATTKRRCQSCLRITKARDAPLRRFAKPCRRKIPETSS